MKEPNTLFLISRFGLKSSDTKGLNESWMWVLEPKDSEMKYVSFHKTKSNRASMGGKIIEFRKPTEEEYELHQEEMRKRDEGQMKSRDERRIICWQRIPGWNKTWPVEAKSNPLDYRAYGYVDPEPFI
mgnify:CR=1 FL=1